MHSAEISQQLRAFRLRSGLRAEDIATKIGISSAAFYRYERSGVVKLETIVRLAELMDISPLTLLGIGIEYYSRPCDYIERASKIEESTDQIIQMGVLFSYLNTSDDYDLILRNIVEEYLESVDVDKENILASSMETLGLLSERKKIFVARPPSVITILTVSAVKKFIEDGIGGSLPLSVRLKKQSREVARHEIQRVIDFMDSEQIGLQFGLVAGVELNGPFVLMRTASDRSIVAINPFPIHAIASACCGVAMITAMEDAVTPHQQIAEAKWRDATKGPAAAKQIKALLAAKMA